jgi:catechol 2,3-dioxygenase-like lactoylglutathione lyase family enzyme
VIGPRLVHHAGAFHTRQDMPMDGQRPLLRGIGHVAIATEDLPRLVAFYKEVIGAQLVGLQPGEGGPRHGFLRIGPTTVLHVFERPRRVKRGRREAFDHGPIDHFTLEAADAEAFAEIRDRLEAGGWDPSAVTDYGPLVSCYFRDPDDLMVELSLWKPPEWEAPFPVVPFAG